MTLVHLDYTLLDREPTRLRIERSAGGYYSVLDQHDVLHLPAFRDLDLVISWMRRAAVDGALLDEESIEFFRAERVFGSLSERDESGVVAESYEAGGRRQMPAESHSRTPALMASRSESDLSSLREGTIGVGREQASPVTSATNGEPTPLPQNVHPIRRNA